MYKKINRIVIRTENIFYYFLKSSRSGPEVIQSCCLPSEAGWSPNPEWPLSYRIPIWLTRFCHTNYIFKFYIIYDIV